MRRQSSTWSRPGPNFGTRFWSRSLRLIPTRDDLKLRLLRQSYRFGPLSWSVQFPKPFAVSNFRRSVFYRLHQMAGRLSQRNRYRISPMPICCACAYNRLNVTISRLYYIFLKMHRFFGDGPTILDSSRVGRHSMPSSSQKSGRHEKVQPGSPRKARSSVGRRGKRSSSRSLSTSAFFVDRSQMFSQ